MDVSHFFPDDIAGEQHWNRQGFVNKFALGKKSIGLDMATEEGRAVFERLVAAADVVIENFSPRVMPNLGFDEHRLREINPRLIYLTMPGYGRTGPASDYSAYGPVLDSHAGLSTLMGYPGVDAWKCGIAWPDPVGGIHGAFAVLAALHARNCDPERRGTTIEVAQFETAVSMIADRLVRAQIDGRDPDIIGNRHPEFAPHGVYRSAGDDRWLALAVTDDDEWRALRALIGAPDSWGSWGIDQRRSEHDRIDEAINAWSSGRSNREAAAMLQAAGVAAAHVADAQDLVEDVHLAHRQFFTELTHPVAGTQRWHGLACRLSVTPAQVRSAAPCLGEHNHDVLSAWAGMTDDEIGALIGAGIIGTEPPE